MSNLLEPYLKKSKPIIAGNCHGIDHRSTLENLLEALEPGIAAPAIPAHRLRCAGFHRREGQNPAGICRNQRHRADLNRVEKSDQLKRYLKALNNLILTDYLEFRWYVNGELRLKPVSLKQLRADA